MRDSTLLQLEKVPDCVEGKNNNEDFIQGKCVMPDSIGLNSFATTATPICDEQKNSMEDYTNGLCVMPEEDFGNNKAGALVQGDKRPVCAPGTHTKEDFITGVCREGEATSLSQVLSGTYPVCDPTQHSGRQMHDGKCLGMGQTYPVCDPTVHGGRQLVDGKCLMAQQLPVCDGNNGQVGLDCRDIGSQAISALVQL